RVFFQAEDGIRDGHVTGVQTCALPSHYADPSEPICVVWSSRASRQARPGATPDKECDMYEFTREFTGEFTYLAGFMAALERHPQIGRASCRERGEVAVGGGSVSRVRV